GGLAVEFHGHQAQVAADAVIDVHHRRAFAQLGEVLDHVVAAVASFLATTTLHHALAEQRVFRDQREVVEQQAFVQRGYADVQRLAAGDESRPAFAFPGLELEAGEQFQQYFAAAGRFGAEQHAALIFLDEAAQRRQWLASLGLDRQVGQGAGVEAGLADAGFDVVLVDHHSRPVLQAGEAVLYRQEDIGRWQQWPLGVDAAILVAVACILPELFSGFLDTGQGENLGVAWQVVEQGVGLLGEERQVVLDAGRRNARGEVLIDGAAAEIHVEALAKAPAEVGNGLFLQRKLTRRQQADRLDLVHRALVFRVEGTQGLDFVVEQIDAVGDFAAHREQIDQCATYGELAVFVHRIDAAVAGGLQA